MRKLGALRRGCGRALVQLWIKEGASEDQGLSLNSLANVPVSTSKAQAAPLVPESAVVDT
jgi:hypothetical protein